MGTLSLVEKRRLPSQMSDPLTRPSKPPGETLRPPDDERTVKKGLHTERPESLIDRGLTDDRKCD